MHPDEHNKDGAAEPIPSPLLPPPSAPSLYRGLALAPMVRAGTLPLRLLALQYGADVVYGEEIIDRKIMHTEREVNETLGTIDFVTVAKEKGGGGAKRCLVFQTTAEEKDRVVFQLGTRNPEWAVQAALLVQHDVAALDVNMGCPKKFSVQDGMGAALLDKPDVAASLIHALRKAVPHLPISCKIRLLDAADPLVPKTVAFAQAMEAAGVCAINVHLRTKEDKPSEPARWRVLGSLVKALRIPVIANGDFYSRKDVEDALLSGCAGVMLARPALYNPSIFRTMATQNPLPLLPLDHVIREYLRLCLRYDNHAANSKYVVMEMMVRRRHPDHIKPQLLPLDLPKDLTLQTVCQIKMLEGLAALWGVEKEAEATSKTAPKGLEGMHTYSDAYFVLPEATTAVTQGTKRPRAPSSDEREEKEKGDQQRRQRTDET